MLIVVGHTPTHVVANDPWCETDLIHGATHNAKGMGLRFSRLNYRFAGLLLRQALDGDPIGGGAYGYAPSRGWAVVVDAILIGATAEKRRSGVPSLLRAHSWRRWWGLQPPSL